MPLFLWFDLFLEARAEILEKNLVFWKHQKEILKLIDPTYLVKEGFKNSRFYCASAWSTDFLLMTIYINLDLSLGLVAILFENVSTGKNLE